MMKLLVDQSVEEFKFTPQARPSKLDALTPAVIGRSTSCSHAAEMTYMSSQRL